MAPGGRDPTPTAVGDGLRWLSTQRVTLGAVSFLLAVFAVERIVWSLYGRFTVAYVFAASAEPSPGWVLAPFAHGTVTHLLTSASMLVVFGALVEAEWGALSWYRLFLAGGYGAVAAQVLAYRLGAPGRWTLGASGAALAMASAYAVTEGRARNRAGAWRADHHAVLAPTAALIVASVLANDFLGLGLVSDTAPYGHLGGVLVGTVAGLVRPAVEG